MGFAAFSLGRAGCQPEQSTATEVCPQQIQVELLNDGEFVAQEWEMDPAQSWTGGRTGVRLWRAQKGCAVVKSLSVTPCCVPRPVLMQEPQCCGAGAYSVGLFC